MRVPRLVLLGLAVCGLALLMGCGGDGDSFLFQNISERASWSTDDQLAYSSFGGNGQKYIYRSNRDGGNQTLLTRSLTTDPDDFTDEGGWNPTHSPDGTQICFAGQRGGSSSLYLMDERDGDRLALTQVTNPGVSGADAQPSWKPDGSKIIFATTKTIGGGTGGFDIAQVNPDGSGLEYLVATNEPENWPVFSPDGTKIAFQRGPETGPTDIIIKDLVSGVETNITTALRTGPGDLTRYEAPAWASVGGEEWIYLHSNRDQFFDIYRIRPTGADLQQITDNTESEGYPVISPDGQFLLFVRSRELWRRAPVAGNVTETRVTRRY